MDKPVHYVEAFAQAGAESPLRPPGAARPTGIAEALRRMEACKVKKAVALRITAPSAVLPYLEGLDMVLVMTVETRLRRPGLSGAPTGHHPPGARPRAVQPRLPSGGGRRGSTPSRPRRSWPPVRTPLVAGCAVYGAAEPAVAIHPGGTDPCSTSLPPWKSWWSSSPGSPASAARPPGDCLSLPEEDAAAFADAISGGKGGHPLLPHVPELLRGGRPVPRLRIPSGARRSSAWWPKGCQGRGGHGALPEYPASITCSTG